jgi:hypothetical protein
MERNFVLIVLVGLFLSPTVAALADSTKPNSVKDAQGKCKEKHMTLSRFDAKEGKYECVHVDPQVEIHDHDLHGGPADDEALPTSGSSASEQVSDVGSVPKAPCPGTGTVGARVEVLYGYFSGDRYSSATVQRIRDIVARADYFLDASTSTIHHVRWYCADNTNVTVSKVQLTDDPVDGRFPSRFDVVTSLRNRGYNSTERIYLVFVDPEDQISNAEGYCGTGGGDRGNSGNDADSPSNPNNSGPEYSLSYCWGSAYSLGSAAHTALHESLHSMGAVQQTAPHSSGFGVAPRYNSGHCYDNKDIMCYNDGASYFAGGGQLQLICPNQSDWWVDCQKDDYYDPTPSAGSYLATHWNVAESVWLTTPK